jgi:uncharacterized membrane protein HdeD (DUF308 family)
MASSRRMGDFAGHLTSTLESKTRYWWLLLIAGIVWLAIGIEIPRFAYATVTTLATLVGVLCLVAAANEVLVGAMSSKRGRTTRWLVAAFFVVVGVVAFLGVKATFIGLAALMSLVFVVWGAMGVLTALAANRERGWWVLAITSLIELAIGLRVAGSLHAPIMTLLTWSTAGTLAHGIGEIASAFLAYRIHRHLASTHGPARNTLHTNE